MEEKDLMTEKSIDFGLVKPIYLPTGALSYKLKPNNTETTLEDNSNLELQIKKLYSTINIPKQPYAFLRDNKKIPWEKLRNKIEPFGLVYLNGHREVYLFRDYNSLDKTPTKDILLIKNVNYIYNNLRFTIEKYDQLYFKTDNKIKDFENNEVIYDTRKNLINELYYNNNILCEIPVYHLGYPNSTPLESLNSNLPTQMIRIDKNPEYFTNIKINQLDLLDNVIIQKKFIKTLTIGTKYPLTQICLIDDSIYGITYEYMKPKLRKIINLKLDIISDLKDIYNFIKNGLNDNLLPEDLTIDQKIFSVNNNIFLHNCLDLIDFKNKSEFQSYPLFSPFLNYQKYSAHVHISHIIPVSERIVKMILDGHNYYNKKYT